MNKMNKRGKQKARKAVIDYFNCSHWWNKKSLAVYTYLIVFWYHFTRIVYKLYRRNSHVWVTEDRKASTFSVIQRY